VVTAWCSNSWWPETKNSRSQPGTAEPAIASDRANDGTVSPVC
jgi:hypothetical protein